MTTLQVDPERLNKLPTGIYVRAQHNGKWCSVDIVELTRESLVAWLREKQAGHSEYAINTVLAILGHNNP